jgi:transposase InsO family protein
MRERGLLARSCRLRARTKKEWGRLEAAEPNQIWQSDMTKIWAGPAVGWAYLVCVIDCCTQEIVGWNLSHRCRTEDALVSVEQAVLERLPEGSRQASVTQTTDNGTPPDLSLSRRRMPLSPAHRCRKRWVRLVELAEEFATRWTERVFFHFKAAPCALLLRYPGHFTTRNSLRNGCHGFFHRSCRCESTAELSSDPICDST